ncbi:MAG: MvaI/BcnI family restriction endonuclease [bacterium]|nr:MvaI/BcnI family restriction endonuclease [bacterium]
MLLIKNNFTFDTVTNISWSFQQLNLRLSKKLKLLALFNVKKFYVKEQNEYYFKYYKMNLYRLKGFDYFLRAIESGYIRLNIKIGFYENSEYYGKIHNKGTTFEIECSKLEELFDLVND